MRFFAIALIFFGVAVSYAQTPEVPHKIQFAGMTLIIRDDARRSIQTDVDALTRSPRHFMMKVERAKTYFPTIEKIFAEERLPDDFKFLVLQESALIADAVSVSNAVGFWQFKDFTAMEMGMRVDKEIDERMNIVSATRGAARYLKKNNYLFNNWLYALQSYQMGAGGVQRAVGDQHNGARHMEITSDTYWYVKKYIAHKVAFENALKGEPQLKVVDYQLEGATTVKEVAQKLSIEEAKLLEYNKWIRNGNIPDDKKYTLLIPVGDTDADFTKLAITSKSTTQPSATSVVKKFINGVPAIKATQGELLSSLAKRANVDLSDFIKYNDIAIDHHVMAGTYYFLEKKKAKAEKPFHQLSKGEDLWMVSQQYGVQLKRIKKYNRLANDKPVIAGTTLWLNSKMPKENDQLIASADSNVLEISHEAFEWQVNSTPGTGTRSKNEVSFQSLPIDSVKKVEPPVITPTPEVATNLEATAKTHTVQQGESLYAIAKRYGVSVTDLMQWNAINVQQGISPGQSLKLFVNEPVVALKEIAADTPSPSPTYHEVKPNDTLYSVARQYGVTIKELMDWNEKTEFTLSLGEKLRVVQK
jgi:membrane-bound lytic murein transglycosylase D